MIIRTICIVITTLLTNSLLASSNNDTTWGDVSPDDGSNTIYTVLKPISTDELPGYSPTSSSVSNTDSQTNSVKEYHTYGPEEQPPIIVWTLFPGPESNVDKPTLITCKTASQLALQHLVAIGCQT